MRNTLVASVVFLTCAADVCFAEDRTLKQTQAAYYFQFESTTFSTTPEQFRRQHPVCQEGSETDKKMAILELRGIAKAASVISVHYFEGKMYKMVIFYDVAKVNKAGGDDIIIQRLKDKFGNYDGDLSRTTNAELDEYEIGWRMNDARKLVEFRSLKKATIITLTDTVIFSAMQEKKQKSADTGF